MIFGRAAAVVLSVLVAGTALAADKPVFPCGDALLLALSIPPDAVAPETIHGQVYWVAPVHAEEQLAQLRQTLDTTGRRLEGEELPAVYPHENQALSELAAIATQLDMCRKYKAATLPEEREALVVEMMRVFHADRALVEGELAKVDALIRTLVHQENVKRLWSSRISLSTCR